MPSVYRALIVSVLCMVPAGCQCGTGPAAFAPNSTPAMALPSKFKDCNLIFVSMDALQAAHVGVLGYPRKVTPTLDALARESIRFTNVYSVASWTVPASMTWFTGVYPSEHKMTNKFAIYTPPLKKPAKLKELSPNLVTLADVLKQNGYATAGFTGNAGVSGGFGYEQGFDIYYHEDGIFGGFDRSIPAALTWLRANRDKKFFVFLHGYDVHGQYAPETGFDYRFVDPGYDRKYTGSELEQETLREEGQERGRLTMRDEDVRFWRAVYDEKVQRSDERFRGFLDEFDKLNLRGKTLFVVTSDHGTELYEHRRFDHGFTLYDEQIRVPLFIRPPGGSPETVVTRRVSSIDVMPTILDLLDVRAPDAVRKQLRGHSLMPAVPGEPIGRDIFSETDYRQYTYKRSVVTPDGWKFIYTLENKSRELYDLTADPGETRNLATIQPSKADDLERKVFAHFAAIGHDLTRRSWEIGLNPVYRSQAKD